MDTVISYALREKGKNFPHFDTITIFPDVIQARLKQAGDGWEIVDVLIYPRDGE